MVKTINEITKEVEQGKIRLENCVPSFYEDEYIDGCVDIHIVHTVEGYEELEVFFAEHEEIQELRQRIWNGKADASELENLVFNEYSDQFNYDKVVFYRIGGYILVRSCD